MEDMDQSGRYDQVDVHILLGVGIALHNAEALFHKEEEDATQFPHKSM
jgi:hypothetical protein